MESTLKESFSVHGKWRIRVDLVNHSLPTLLSPAFPWCELVAESFLKFYSLKTALCGRHWQYDHQFLLGDFGNQGADNSKKNNLGVPQTMSD